MISDQAGKVTRPIEDSVPIIRGLPGTQNITPLPEHIGRNTLGIERGRLPRCLDTAVIRGIPILLQKTGLTGGDTCVTVGLDPCAAPGACLTPCECDCERSSAVMGMYFGVLTAVGVEVEGTKVDGADTEVHGEVQALTVGEGVAAV